MTVTKKENTYKDNKGKERNEVIVENAKLAYVELSKPELKFEKEDEYEYSLSFVADEDFADEWSDRFKKASVRKVKTAEFEDKYKFKPPFPKDKNQYILRCTASAQTKDKITGEVSMLEDNHPLRPKVFKKNESGKLEDITSLANVGNGSTGILKFAVGESKFIGTHPYLRGLLVTDLVEFVSSGGGSYNPFSDYGEIEDNIPDFGQEEETPETSESKNEEFDDDIPF